MNPVKIKPRKGRPRLAQRGSAGTVGKTIQVPEGRPGSPHFEPTFEFSAGRNTAQVQPPALRSDVTFGTWVTAANAIKSCWKYAKNRHSLRRQPRCVVNVRLGRSLEPNPRYRSRVFPLAECRDPIVRQGNPGIISAIANRLGQRHRSGKGADWRRHHGRRCRTKTASLRP